MGKKNSKMQINHRARKIETIQLVSRFGKKEIVYRGKELSQLERLNN